MTPGRSLRAARQSADTLGAHPLAQRLRRRRGPKLLEDRERLALLRVGTVPGEQVRVLVRTAQFLPGPCGAAPVTRDLPRVGLRDLWQWSLESIDSPQPGRELAVHTGVGPLSREFIGGQHSANDSVAITREPRRLGACRGEHADPLQNRHRSGELPSLLQWSVRIRVAAAYTQVPECP